MKCKHAIISLPMMKGIAQRNMRYIYIYVLK